MPKAMIFAAGLGTRLAPITDSKPKALAEVNGKPLLEYAILHLKLYGITELVINVHHFADQIVNFLKSNNNFGVSISISDETEKLLDTGGGLKRAAVLLTGNEPIILYNVDVISNINLKGMLDHHASHNSMATLAVRSRKTSRYFLFNHAGELCGWKNLKTNEIRLMKETADRLSPLAFSGIQVISPRLLPILEDYPGTVFSITNFYIDRCRNYKFMAFIQNTSVWFDLGTIEKIEEASKVLSATNLF